jgi:hypothetical protein
VPAGDNSDVVALRAGTGIVDWSVALPARRARIDAGFAVTPDGSTLYVAGDDVAGLVTTALASRNGSALWSATHAATDPTTGGEWGTDAATALVANPVTGEAVVGGDAQIRGGSIYRRDFDMLVLDYPQAGGSSAAAPVTVTGPLAVQGVPSRSLTFDVALHTTKVSRIGRLTAQAPGADASVSFSRVAEAVSPGAAPHVAVTVDVGATQVSGFDVLVTACDPDYSLTDCSTTTVHVSVLV